MRRPENMLDMFSGGLFEGVKPMMVSRDHLVRHPDRCNHQAVCIPVCPTGAWLSTPRINSMNRGAWNRAGCASMPVPSQAIYAVFRKGEKLLVPQAE